MQLNEDSTWSGRVYFIPVNPVPKGRPRLGRGGRVFTPQITRVAEITIKQYLRLQKPPLQHGPIRVIVQFLLQKPKSVKREYHTVKPDCDNLLKLLLDAGNDILWRDDSQIVQLECSKQYATDKVGTYITIMEPEF